MTGALSKITVSVIIPTWNRDGTIEGAVRSALGQAGLDLEVLVCDDGSADRTEEVVRSIRDDRIRWIPGGRGGRPAIPRNRGIRASRGNWLAFLDSDDEWLPGKLERQITKANDSGSTAVCSNGRRFIPGHGICGNVVAWNMGRLTFDDLLRVNHIICSSVLVKKELIERCGGFPEDPRLMALEDYALWLRLATWTDIAFVHEPLLVYRDDPSASARREGPDPWTQKRWVINDFLSWGGRNGAPLSILAKAAVSGGHASLVSIRNKLLSGNRPTSPGIPG